MLSSKYYYNSKTCQYERARLRWSDVAGYVSGTVLTASIFFVAILALQNKIVKTEDEIALRNENAALDKHKASLADELTLVEAALSELQTKDQQLSAKLFETNDLYEKEENPVRQKSDILFADASGFQEAINALKTKSSVLAEKSASTNANYSNTLHLSKKDIELMQSLPSLLPVDNTYLDQLASGFGTRINPFHKGLHQHLGIDFVAPRGTNVQATGRGKVIEVRRNNLQAGYGTYIEIDHGHGFITRYAHLEEVFVRAGQRIEKGFTLGTVGSSGGSVAPHVHYEVIRDGDNVDPVHFMIEGLSSADHRKISVRAKKQNQSLD